MNEPRDVASRDASGFDDAAIERLRLAAEEVAWLTGRGYPLEKVGALVASHHGLSANQQAALARGTCSEPQYRRRAARELEPEDIARRPLSIDLVDAIATIEAAGSGQPVLQTLDGTMRAFGVDKLAWTPGPGADAALASVLAATKELRPSMLRLLVDERAASAADLEARATAAAKLAKAKIELVRVADVAVALRKEKQIVTGDADTLDACAAWFNLVGRVVEGIPNARIIRLQ